MVRIHRISYHDVFDIPFLGHIPAFTRKEIVLRKFIAVYAAESITRFSPRCSPSSDPSHNRTNEGILFKKIWNYRNLYSQYHVITEIWFPFTYFRCLLYWNCSYIVWHRYSILWIKLTLPWRLIFYFSQRTAQSWHVVTLENGSTWETAMLHILLTTTINQF